jgi:hypothetical protein
MQRFRGEAVEAVVGRHAGAAGSDAYSAGSCDAMSENSLLRDGA